MVRKTKTPAHGFALDHLHVLGEDGFDAPHEVIFAPYDRSGAPFVLGTSQRDIYALAQDLLSATGELTIATPSGMPDGDPPLIQWLNHNGTAVVERFRVLMSLPGGRGMLRTYTPPDRNIVTIAVIVANGVAALSPEAREEWIFWGASASRSQAKDQLTPKPENRHARRGATAP